MKTKQISGPIFTTDKFGNGNKSVKILKYSFIYTIKTQKDQSFFPTQNVRHPLRLLSTTNFQIRMNMLTSFVYWLNFVVLYFELMNEIFNPSALIQNNKCRDGKREKCAEV